MQAAAPSEADDAASGLTARAAAERLAAVGPNAVPEPRPDRLGAVLRQFWAPVPWMLEAAILLQAALGEYLEAAVIAGLLAFNAALSFFQEGRAQTALAALKSRLALTASVRRDGVWQTVPAAELVPDDVVKLSLGAVVPADVRLLAGAVLLDQSMLTGESVPSEASTGDSAYAGALVRRGEATACVTATGVRTFSGRAAELVRIAHAESAEQRAIFAVVRNLAVLNGALVVLTVAWTRWRAMPAAEVVPLVLTALLASVPVALPATFTLATALGAQRLARRGVLPTRLEAVHEAAAMDVLCSDKTGTLTQNALRVAAVHPLDGRREAEVLAWAALASAEGGADPLDAAVRAATAAKPLDAPAPRARRFIPFDPSRKCAEAIVTMPDGSVQHVLKGAFAALAPRVADDPQAARVAARLAAEGNRVLAVAAGPEGGALALAGLLALSDPPRPDAAPLIATLAGLGVRTVMVTGDAPETAAGVARAVGLAGPVRPAAAIGTRPASDPVAAYAGVFPEDKYRLVGALQAAGHVVGMCGDGANDAPALRQAQVGIAVASATDVAKAAAAVVLTEPGLGGIVAAVEEGRATFQRILTYTLNMLIKKIEWVAFLGLGLVLTGHAVMTPLLMVLLLVTNDFLTMSLTTDRVAPTPRPQRWRVARITLAAAALGLFKLAFSLSVLAVGGFVLGLTAAALRTLAFVTLVFGSQAIIYAVRERRRLWSSRPSGWILLSSLADIAIATAIALSGALSAPLSFTVVTGLFAAAAAFALLFDAVKRVVFRRCGIA